MIASIDAISKTSNGKTWRPNKTFGAKQRKHPNIIEVKTKIKPFIFDDRIKINKNIGAHKCICINIDNMAPSP